MGRKATVNLNLPKGMRARKRKKKGELIIWYYYDAGGKPRKEIPLGSDYIIACKKWSELSLEKLDKSHRITFVQAAQRFKLEELPLRKPKTQNGYKSSMKQLLLFFGGSNPVALEDIDVGHIKDYLTWRKDTPVAANRDLALFSAIWTMCSPANWNYINKECPSKGVKKYKEQPRDVYVEDYIYELLYRYGAQDLQDAMRMAMMLGQRPSDMLKIHTGHIHNGILNIKQNKTSNPLRFKVTESLQEIITRRAPHGGYLFLNKRKRKMNISNLEYRYNKARDIAIQKHAEHAEELAQAQFRDLRAKSATDKSLVSSEEAAQKLLGHSNVNMTKRVYIRRSKEIDPFEEGVVIKNK